MGEIAQENRALKLSVTDVDGNAYQTRMRSHIIWLGLPCNNIVKIGRGRLFNNSVEKHIQNGYKMCDE